MTYRQATAYLDTLTNYEKERSFSGKRPFKLQRIEAFLSSLGSPQKDLKCIHIAGTKGKGSTAIFTAAILRSCGYRVGLYTSPHLSDLRERIRVLTPSPVRAERNVFEGMISRKDFAALAGALKPRVEAFGRLSYFEALTAMAFEYFRAKKVDFVVVETGLGGRLDATNTVSPLICAITPISYDHQDILGPTLSAIASEKCGIIKSAAQTFARRQLTVLTAPQPLEAMRVVRQRCRQRHARLFAAGREFIVDCPSCDARGARFSLRSPWGTIKDVRIRLAGEHQIINASLAVSIILALRAGGWVKNDDRGLRAGLAAAQWPGRMEPVAVRPTVLLDGAHNQASAKALAEALRSLYPHTKKTLVLGISQDKDVAAICRQLAPCAQTIVVTRAAHSRALPVPALEQVARGCLTGLPGKRVLLSAASCKQALRIAKNAAGAGGIVVVCGSLFLAAEARKLLK